MGQRWKKNKRGEISNSKIYMKSYTKGVLIKTQNSQLEMFNFQIEPLYPFKELIAVANTSKSPSLTVLISR